MPVDRPVEPTPAHPTARFGFRPEIEGLRAVAVVLVVLDHLALAPHGGFVGVDVFFVISGFLITGLLVDEQARTGRVSVRGFYARRARRILPAALLVLLGTYVASRLVLLAGRAHETTVDIGWAAAFLANVHFAAVGTDYFQADRPPSPVQHFWSLAVEEQFYLVWPLALFALLWAAGRLLRGRSRRAVTTAVTAVVAGAVAGLFALSVVRTGEQPTAAYFATPARAWELGVGAVLALAAVSGLRIGRRTATLLVPTGLALVVLAGFVTRDGTGFPAPDAALPVAGAALVVLGAGAGAARAAAWPLTNPVSRYLGRVSYSLYLWHWPVIVLVAVRFTGPHAWAVAIDVLITVALTVATHHLVENPLRRASFWRGWGARTRASRRGVRVGFAATAVAPCCAVAATVVWQLSPAPAHHGYAPTAGAAVPPRPSGQLAPPTALRDQISAALDATHFPSLTPSLADLANSKVSEWKPCGNVLSLTQCTFPATGGRDPSGVAKKIVVIGDSIGITWLPALRGLQSQGYTVYGLTHSQCPAVTVRVNAAVGGGSQFADGCTAHRAWSVAQVARLHPDIVVLASSLDTVRRLASGATGAAAYAEWQRGTTTTIRDVRAAGAKRVVVMSPPPTGQSLQTCASSPDADPGGCVSRVGPDWYGVTAAERTATAAAGATYVDTKLLFCATNDWCPSFVGNSPVRVDGLHLTEPYSARLGTIIDPVVRGS